MSRWTRATRCRCAPGMAHEIVELELPPTATVIVSELAALDGLPVGLWAALAVESERARGSTPTRRRWTRRRASSAPPAPYPTPPDGVRGRAARGAPDRPGAGADRDAGRLPHAAGVVAGRRGLAAGLDLRAAGAHAPPASPLGGGGRRAGADARGVGRYRVRLQVARRLGRGDPEAEALLQIEMDVCRRRGGRSRSRGPGLTRTGSRRRAG